MQNFLGCLKILQDLKNATKKTFKTSSNVMLMILDFKYCRARESLSVSSMTKTLAVTRKGLETTTVLKKDHTVKKLFTALRRLWEWLEQQEECDAVQLMSLKLVRDLASIKTRR
ncbi:hypothetical protein AVEN_14791-1 [Araneus ventricosus]|uniref:Uncharacterized protein n=1 Tax=Araneus ventricosus TaxID=182803 RepID=A0A4Y2FJW8_ARAVE|nr:hypothetical protein AVEN_14791-1 [Araneus ventricosus]